jgi:hypothetical protein
MITNKLQKLVLTISLMVAASFACANSEKMTVINPACVDTIYAIDDALTAAHAKGEFLKINVVKNEPVMNESEMCNINLDVDVKDRAEAEILQSQFRAYMTARLEIKMGEAVFTDTK